ncbi:MAG: DUF1385 domain-containing protein [Ruminococcaceae bacterium]|nr:DUF1385 domain-containing protein [Oscillospiraceae bacterium]
MAKKKCCDEKFKTMIGGQALIEGIMMLGPEKSATVVRAKDGIHTKVEDRKPPKKGFSLKKIPLVRGVFNFCTSMKVGIKAMMYSANFFMDDDDDQPAQKQSKFDAWLERKLESEKAQSVLVTIALVLGMLMSVGLFIVLPSIIGSVLGNWVHNEVVLYLVEGVVRIFILLAYMYLISKMNDMKRVFAYHGAEHKTIRCYEAKLPLTVENVRRQTRLHPRCGTSFLFVVLFISILVFSVASILLKPITPDFDSAILDALVRIGLKLLLLPIVVGIAYEFNRLVGRYDNWLTRALSAPGMWLQYITTNEPDDEMIEVGIEALSLVLPEQEGTDQW